MTWDKLFYIADKIVQRYFLPISITLLIHLLIFGFLIILEMSKPDKPADNQIMIDFSQQQDESSSEMMQNEVNKQEMTDVNGEDAKNVEKNMGESNKSFQDYYREAKDILDKGQSKENFKANDYKDQRWLVKDYSKETPDIQNWDKPQNQDNNNNYNKSNSNSTYAGNAIVSYDLGGRRSVRLPIPAYKCVGQGKVTIEVFVNQRGEIVSARIADASNSLSESCLPNSALESARNSRFVPNEKAPASQKGYIYYTFVAQ